MSLLYTIFFLCQVSRSKRKKPYIIWQNPIHGKRLLLQIYRKTSSEAAHYFQEKQPLESDAPVEDKLFFQNKAQRTDVPRALHLKNARRVPGKLWETNRKLHRSNILPEQTVDVVVAPFRHHFSLSDKPFAPEAAFLENTHGGCIPDINISPEPL